VKIGAEVFAEALVLGTGLLTVGAEVYRKDRADEAAAQKKLEQEAEEKRRHEIVLHEREQQLRKKLLALQDRLISVENAKFTSLHDKVAKDHLALVEFCDHLLDRIEHLERHAHAPPRVALSSKNRPHRHAPAPLEELDLIKFTAKDLDEALGSVEDAVKVEMKVSELAPLVARVERQQQQLQQQQEDPASRESAATAAEALHQE
jgi:hypothetical protein